MALAAGSIGLALKFFRRTSLPTVSLPLPQAPEAKEMVPIPGGRFQMGSDLARSSAERPQHEVAVRAFLMDAHEVTVADFAHFVAETGYVTTAEHKSRAWVFVATRKEWVLIPGADWRHPLGPHSSTVGHERLPVVQVSWQDAAAYARWAGKRLPTEAEWEFAARGGLYDADFPWGREEQPGGAYEANYWQGWFPDQDLARDGYRTVAPVKSYSPNRFGLYDMAGNVWEWCADWYAADYYQTGPTVDPTGPAQGTHRVQRGGSWLSADNTRPELRVWTRGRETPESCHNHVGFRCVRDVR
jgi:formylglycine-generating enzyme required for sulfatase activity